MSLGEFDAGGRRRPLPIPGAEFSLDVDQVLVAIGQQPVFPFPAEEDNPRISKRGLLNILLKGKPPVDIL
ncbi:MAG: glutamate synthase (NADPH/NADH) small chain [bacterium]|nr:MAG: glutamate synthase (NADPH/NADH) small chain [bacterium]